MMAKRRLTAATVMAVLAASLAVRAQSGGGAAASPESVYGFQPCADYQLATYEQAVGYLRGLDSASPRVQLSEVGQTAEGRPQVLAIISSEANIKNLERYRSISARLASGRDLTDEQARALAAEGRTVVWIDFGMYSGAIGPPQIAPEIAWRVATDESPRMRAIRDNVIFLMMPNLNPDGTAKVVNWYRSQAKTTYEPTHPPEILGLDNNRDWFMYNLPETRNAGRVIYQQWFPQIVHNHSQAGQFPARIFIPPFADPTNPNIPPMVMRGINIVGSAMARQLEKEGKSGVLSRVRYDTWWNGGTRTTPYFHNMIGILTETQHPSPFPVTYDPAAFPDTFVDGTSTRVPSVNYPNPFRGGEWHLRNSCEYMMSASLAVLDIAAERRQEWLYDVYRMAREAITAGAREQYLIPPDQWDAATAVKLVNVLRLGGVEVERATGPVTAGTRTFAAGTYLIRGSQAYLPYIRDLLTPQVYTYRSAPYDIAGWTLPIQMGVKVEKVEEVRGTFEPVVTAPVPVRSPVREARVAYAIDGRANDAARLVNELLGSGDEVYRVKSPLQVQGETWPPGTFIVRAGTDTRARIAAAVTRDGVPVAELENVPAAEFLKLRAPRIGVYRAWVTRGNTDEGWTRWLLGQYGFSMASIRDAELRAGDLRARYDVILLPSATADSMLHGNAAGTVPPEYAGGMGVTGAAALFEFVNAGGTLVAQDQAAALPVDLFGMQIENAVGSLRGADFLIPGSLLRVSIDSDHPLGYGMPRDAAAFFARSPAFEIGRPRTDFEDDIAKDPAPPPGVRVVAQYPNGPLLLSGWTNGERHLHGRAAIVEAAIGKGRVVLLGFRTQHRGQAHGTFKLLFNAIYLAGSEPAQATWGSGAAR